MKAADLASVLHAQAALLAPGKAKDALRFLSFALSQLPASKAAGAALTELSEKLKESGSLPVGEDSTFGDLSSALTPLTLLGGAGGTKGTKDCLALLVAITKEHAHRSVRASENLLAPGPAPRRTKKPPPQADKGMVAKHVSALRSAKPGTDSFGAAHKALAADVLGKKASVADLKQIAAELEVPRPGTTTPKLLAAIAREHETILETLHKIGSGSNAA